MIQAKKSLGQNFLEDENTLLHIIEAASLLPNDHVLEIGPGKGALTDKLLDKAAQVTALELDERLISFLKKRYSGRKNFHLLHIDALSYKPPSTTYKIVANIPYYITSPLLRHYLFEQFLDGNPPKSIIFMLQKEVAQKIMAKKAKHSLLSLQVHMFGEPKWICSVEKRAFNPRPKVDSAVIKINVNEKAKLDVDLKKLFWLFKVSFAQKRKKLSKNLSNVLNLQANEIKERLTKLGINKDIRAEALSIEEWGLIYEAFLT